MGAPRSNSDWSWNNPVSAVEQFLGENSSFELVEPIFPFNEVNVVFTYGPHLIFAVVLSFFPNEGYFYIDFCDWISDDPLLSSDICCFMYAFNKSFLVFYGNLVFHGFAYVFIFVN